MNINLYNERNIYTINAENTTGTEEHFRVVSIYCNMVDDIPILYVILRLIYTTSSPHSQL